jgi:hypothetical protein
MLRNSAGAKQGEPESSGEKLAETLARRYCCKGICADNLPLLDTRS